MFKKFFTLPKLLLVIGVVLAVLFLYKSSNPNTTLFSNPLKFIVLFIPLLILGVSREIIMDPSDPLGKLPFKKRIIYMFVGASLVAILFALLLYLNTSK